jgi:hypothetical protein
MPMTKTRIDEITGAVFLIGLGCLFYFGLWPGILFLVGGIMIVRGMAERRGWESFQGAAWVIAVGIWSLLQWNIGALLILIGTVMLIPVLFRRPAAFHSVKPEVDNYLD